MRLRSALRGGSRAFVLLRVMLLAALLAFTLSTRSRPYSLDVVMDADIPVTATAQIFYSFDGLSYYPENSQIMRRDVVDGRDVIGFSLHTARPIRTIRLDPLNEIGALRWSGLLLKGSAGRWERRGAELAGVFRDPDQLKIVSSGADGLQMEATGNDSKMLVDVPDGLMRLSWQQRAMPWLKSIGIGLLLALVVELVLRACGREHPVRRAVAAWLGRVARRLSDPGVLVMPASAVGVYLVLAVLAGVWVAAKLHQSSIGLWDGMYPPEHVERLVSIGSPKPIRSDEWGTLTPWILNQAQTGMKNDNANIGAPGSPMLAGAPVLSPVMVAQPKYWGFVLLDVERGFSWYWAYKSFGLVAAFFTLLLVLTRGDTVVSLAGALAMYGASYIQWWYSSVPSEAITGFVMAVVGSIYLLQARGTTAMALGALLAALSVPNLLLQLYPPFLLMMGYLAVFLLGGLLLNAQGLAQFRFRQSRRWVFIGLGVLLMGLLVGSWYHQVKDAAEAIVNTSYPGKRVNHGGDYPLYAIFYGVFESWKIDDSLTPFPPVNPSEASTFWILFPIALILVPWRRLDQPVVRVVAVLMAYCFIVLAWASLPLPSGLRALLAHLGWALVPGFRVQLGLAVASALMMGVLVSAYARGELKPLRLPSLLPIVVALIVVAAYGRYLQTMDPAFFSNGRIALGVVAVGLLALAVLRGWRWLYLVVMVLVALPTLYVNPIQSGLEPYFSKRSFQQARQVGGGPDDKWAVFGNLRVAQGFRSVGLNVINGTLYTPRADLLSKLDPQSQYKGVWNRYAHVELVGAESTGLAPRFEIRYADHYRVFLDVCGAHIRAAGVTHVAYTYVPSARELACMEPLVSNDFSGVNLYRLKALN